MSAPTDQSNRNARRRTRRLSAKWIGLGLAVLWVGLLVLVYVVVVKLKLGGTQGIQRQAPASETSAD